MEDTEATTATAESPRPVHVSGLAMTREGHLLDILIEECAEVIQRVTKAKRFGLQEIQPEQALTNIERIVYELNDIVAVADMLMGSEWLNDTLIAHKRSKVETFLEYSESCGMVINEPERDAGTVTQP